jgi:hypothetical protein
VFLPPGGGHLHLVQLWKLVFRLSLHKLNLVILVKA